MLTLGTYLNLIEAGLAKSFLDDHNVFCSLFDENVHLYGGAPFAMPIRLVVTDAQFEQAARILADASRPVAEGGSITTEPRGHERIHEVDQETIGEDQERVVEEALASNNPWEILAIAYLFFVPGLGFLLENRSLILITRRAYRGPGTFIVLLPLGLHFVGVLLIAASLLLTFCYFYSRRVMARDEQAARVAQSSES